MFKSLIDEYTARVAEIFRTHELVVEYSHEAEMVGVGVGRYRFRLERTDTGATDATGSRTPSPELAGEGVNPSS